MQVYKIYTLILALRFKKSNLLALARLNPRAAAYFLYSKLRLFLKWLFLKKLSSKFFKKGTYIIRSPYAYLFRLRLLYKAFL